MRTEEYVELMASLADIANEAAILADRMVRLNRQTISIRNQLSADQMPMLPLTFREEMSSGAAKS